MRITCSNCAAQYEVPPPRLPADRKVRCARCNTEWRVAYEAKAPAAEPAAIGVEPATLAGDSQMTVTSAEPAAGKKWRPKLGWAVSIMALVIIGAAVFHWRAAVMRIWPPSGRILALTETTN